MRNDTERWDFLSKDAQALQHPHVAFTPLPLMRQTWISGVDVLRTHGPTTGWPKPAQGDTYAVGVRRDRVLIVGGAPRAEGWDAALGEAVSDMTEGLAMFALSGPAALDVLKRGTEIDTAAPSRSAMRRFAGMDVALYRYADPQAVRFHVPIAHTQAFANLVHRVINDL